MQELTPKEYADLLNEDGELALEKMSDEQKAAAVQRLALARASRVVEL